MNKTIIKTMLVIAVLFLPRGLFAEDLSVLIERIKNHPEIISIKEKIEAEKKEVERLKALPDPITEFGLSNKEMGIDGSLMFQQTVPYPGKLDLMSKMKGFDVNMLEQKLTSNMLQRIEKTKNDYYELFLMDKSIQITKKTKKYLETMRDSALSMYSVGMIPQTDILRIETELLMQDEKLIMLNAKKEALRYKIMWDDIGLQEGYTLTITIPDEINQTPIQGFDELKKTALKNSTVLKMAFFEIEERKAALELANLEFKPDFVASSEIMTDKNWTVKLALMWPLYKEKKQKKAKEGAERNLFASQNIYEKENLELLSMIKEAYLMASSTSLSISLYKTKIIPSTNLTWESSLTNYKTGKTDFLFVFDNLMKLQESELRYYELLVGYEKAVAEIERLIGGKDVSIAD